jgi:hypothetical protein
VLAIFSAFLGNDLARNAGVTDEDIEALNKVRDRNPAEPLRFE